MKPVMYIFVNSKCGMSAGKMAAQASHAAVEAFRLSPTDYITAWYEGKHYTKLVMDGGDGFQLGTIQNYLDSRGFATDLIIDEGRTEDTYFIPTALGVQIVDKDDPHTAATFESFKTYRDPNIAIVAPLPAPYKPSLWLRLNQWFGFLEEVER